VKEFRGTSGSRVSRIGNLSRKAKEREKKGHQTHSKYCTTYSDLGGWEALRNKNVKDTSYAKRERQDPRKGGKKKRREEFHLFVRSFSVSVLDRRYVNSERNSGTRHRRKWDS